MDILIPCKAFARGKSRLAGVLAPGQRAALCQTLFRHTLAEALATGARVAVVAEDTEVADLARTQGALVIADPGSDLCRGSSWWARPADLAAHRHAGSERRAALRAAQGTGRHIGSRPA